MTNLEENTLMIVKTISHYKGKTTKELQQIPDCWLNKYSQWGIDFWLNNGEHKGYIKSKVNKKGDLIYYATRKGIKKYNENF